MVFEEFSIEWKDRAWHEMHTLMDIFCQAGCYDQLNMGALACMELVNRRLQQYTEACAHGADAPNSASAKHVSGSSSSLDLVPPGDAIVCESSHQGGGGTQTFTCEIKDTRSQPWRGGRGCHSWCSSGRRPALLTLENRE